MMMHYGSYPFPPDNSIQMTINVFLIGLGMLSTKIWWLLWRKPSLRNGSPVTRKRRPVDDVRMLFQSVAESPESELDGLPSRQEDDDEDLLDVLVTIMQKRPGRAKYTRADMVPVAEQLPSSCSRRLHGKIHLNELRALLALAMDLCGALIDPSPGKMPRALQSLIRSFAPSSCDSEAIGWEPFHTTIIQSFPNLLNTLLAFFQHTFQPSTHGWPEPALLPKPCRLPQILSASNILSAERLCQLMLVLPGALTLHFNAITLQAGPDGNGANVSALLHTAGRLFLVKAWSVPNTGYAPGEEEEEGIVAVFTGAPADRYDCHFFAPGSWRNGSVVPGLAPRHEVYYAEGAEDEGGGFVVEGGAGSLELRALGVEMVFRDGMRLLEMKTGSGLWRGRVEVLEVWSM
ncbi:hypothetical protein K458DRAFT_311368 [Lentithecium fluviatile CBS 122367]|uniref:Uncharacterized protein n=1 Tax=Lentithecium fluviatile CBS 122367 TaxID=1168545 RepID=A0A6G1IRI2_9PLEO|nr:hypothetical protein K458DRAFT_311368 [Lentithecium fluviatile CBS 122367]